MIGIKRYDCIGCGACEAACPQKCIKMKYDFEGFKYPHYKTENCIGCGKCKQACPVQFKREKTFLYALAGHGKRDELLERSTSGAIFPLLASAVLNKGGIVYGAAFDKDFNVIHISAHNEKELDALKQSKYVQSDMGNIFTEIKNILEEGKWVLFSGTSCQVGALQSFLHKDYERLLCVGIICHGVAAPKIWEKYLDKFYNKKSIKKINFRAKDFGWEKIYFSIQYKDGTEYIIPSHEDPFMHGFYFNHFLRKTCYNCKFKGIESSCDITLGDAWGVNTYARNIENNKGTSLILVHSLKGKYLIEKILNQIEYEEINIRKAVKYNLRLIKSVSQNEKREEFYISLKKMKFKVCMKKFLKK